MKHKPAARTGGSIDASPFSFVAESVKRVFDVLFSILKKSAAAAMVATVHIMPVLCPIPVFA
jgi:hypothetical protein